MTTTQVIVGENEGLEGALKRFKRKCQKDGIIADIRRKVEYTKPSVARKVKSDNARKRARKEAREGRPSFNPNPVGQGAPHN